ncbi:tRNA (adenosine(37)-N6)-threonylcarbamoyltransferase complex dimerization subunit type 1 TsaB [Mycoplasma phocoenae]|uniref:tRNA (Adenosine(37)-N6)-threonylcarbamoyltransferase complex dimerization subunit type 1 TsaB n=1 Tax=Mycoplasma phocoenae TaxID=754517 RepID=A0A858U7K6_9MOLU|nr:tRNA (adenosine(37)-N6)-threonylcarbamoyltransferase complex dimerization subunit type 1 TsaB [Mycoplasma phocoenae]QJG67235.1 tRNA (adenosine(37)-N6)-threonylcarbamoyltransferase complex dimerization subunit type 1 TsaB [Mycoplasma phocoenae]
MKLFFDTCLEDLVIALLGKDSKLVSMVKLESLKKKVDILPRIVNQILNENNININDITDMYFNIGPGSFTGSRIALVYCRTIALFKPIKLHTYQTHELINKQTNKKVIHIKASKYSAYQIIFNKDDSIESNKISTELFDSVDYDELLNNFNKYQSIFKEVTDIDSLETTYFHEAKIGGE